MEQLQKLNLPVVLEEPYVTIRFAPEEKFIWNEWRGCIPSPQLREAMMWSSEFIIENDVELILADFTHLCAPALDDQIWIAGHTGPLLAHSRLRKVANLMAQDLFQQIAIETIYEKASETPQPCETQEFFSKEDALIWLFSD